jgi:hypothetical protein
MNNYILRNLINIKKGMLILSFLLLTISLYIAHEKQALEYEASILTSTPIILWASIVISIIVGITLIISSFHTNKNDYGDFFSLLSILLLFSVYTIAMGLPIIRGYYMWLLTGDPATHIGWTLNLIDSGHVPNSIIYPILHVFTAEISIISALDLIILQKFIPFFFSLLYIPFFYILFRILLPKKAVIIGLCLCFTFWVGWFFHFTPNLLSNLFFPLVLFVIFRFTFSKDFKWGLLISILLIMYSLFHPVSTIALCLFLFALLLGEYTIKSKYLIKAFPEKKCFNMKVLIIPLLILCVTFIFWISGFRQWTKSISSIYESISREGEMDQLTRLSNRIEYTNVAGYNFFDIMMRMEFGIIVIFILSFFALYFIWNKQKENDHSYLLFSLYFPIFSFCLLTCALFFLNLFFSPLRFLVYMTMICTILASYFIYSLLILNFERYQVQSRRVIKYGVATLLIGLSVSGLVMIYPSPYVLLINYQTTNSEVSGMQHFFNYRDPIIPISAISISPGRYGDFLLNPEEQNYQKIPFYVPKNLIAPWHFGYFTNQSLSNYYIVDTDLIISQRDKVTYIDTYPEIAVNRFQPQDFEKLHYDKNVNLVYNNHGFENWRIIV